MLNKLDFILGKAASLGGRAHPELTLFLRYSISGGVSALVDITLVYCLTEYLHFHPLASGALSTVITLVLNFLILKFWSFRSKGNLIKEFITYGSVAIAGITINYLSYSSLILLAKIPYLSARLIAIIIAWGWNYTLNRKFSFRNIRES